MQRALSYIFSRLLDVSQVIPSQQRRVFKLVVMKWQSACAHNSVFNAPLFQFFFLNALLRFVGAERGPGLTMTKRLTLCGESVAF